MARDMMENLQMIREMARESLSGRMADSTMENGKEENSMEEALILVICLIYNILNRQNWRKKSRRMAIWQKN
jgi:hypothetical protein